MTYVLSPGWGKSIDPHNDYSPGQRTLTAQVRCPPEHAGLCLGALLGVGGHRRAEALTVPTRVTRAGVMHTGLIEDRRVHLEGEPGTVTQNLPLRPGWLRMRDDHPGW